MKKLSIIGCTLLCVLSLLVSCAEPTNKVEENYLLDTGNISFTVGSEFLIPNKHNLTNLFGLNYSMAFTKTGPYEELKKADSVNTKNVIPLFNPYYALIYDDIDNLYIKGSIHLNLGGVSLKSEQEQTGIVGLTGSAFVMKSGFKFDIIYNIIPKTLKFNVSSNIDLPVLLVMNLDSSNPVIEIEGVYSSPVNANIKTGIDWNLTENFSMTLDLNATIAPRLSSSVIDGITFGVNYKKHTKY